MMTARSAYFRRMVVTTGLGCLLAAAPVTVGLSLISLSHSALAARGGNGAVHGGGNAGGNARGSVGGGAGVRGGWDADVGGAASDRARDRIYDPDHIQSRNRTRDPDRVQSRDQTHDGDRVQSRDRILTPNRSP